VIPHSDNAEGGTHDTRFCYLGEERLEFLEREVPEGDFVLGVDEHTAVTFDLDSGEATIAGRGHVTIRVKGNSAVIEAGEVVPTSYLLELGAGLAKGAKSTDSAGRESAIAGVDEKSSGGSAAGGIRLETAPETAATGATGTPLLRAIRTFEAAFRAARAAADAQAMVSAALDLNDELWAWVADPNQSDELDRGRAALRAMIVELGSLAGESMRDPAELFGPFVDLLVETRTLAREERRFAEADAVRDQLAALGIELHDTPEGSSWDRSSNVERVAQGGPTGAN
jgi:hypothetical protein